MAIQFKVGNFQWNAADSGTKAITGVGFVPQGYLLTTVRLNGTAVQGTGITYAGDGMTDGTNQYAQCFTVNDGASSSSAHKHVMTNRVLYIGQTGGGADIGSLSHLSFDADGFTTTINTQTTATITVFYVAWAGFSNVYLDVFQTPTATGSFSRTAAGFQPDALLFLSASATATGAATGALRSIGWSVASGNQFSVGARQINGSTSNYTTGTAATDRVTINVDNTGASLATSIQMTSHDATGFTADRVTGTTAAYVAAMHFGGGVWHAGSVAAQSSTGTFDVATAGSNPVGVFTASQLLTTASRTAPFEGSAICLGAADATSQFAALQLTANRETLSGGQVSEEYQRADASKVWIDYQRTGADTLTAVGEVAMSSLAGGKFVLDQTDADPTAILIGYLSVGNAPVSSGAGNSGMLLGIGI